YTKRETRIKVKKKKNNERHSERNDQYEIASASVFQLGPFLSSYPPILSYFSWSDMMPHLSRCCLEISIKTSQARRLVRLRQDIHQRLWCGG
ncbi:hypothetical protein T310_9082, partial [Rasamsonia emersonii CBS 393.64]